MPTKLASTITPVLRRRGRVLWPEWLVGCTGVWLCLSPFALGFDHDARPTLDACLVGAGLVSVNLLSMLRVTKQGSDLLNLVLGMWLMLSPIALDTLGDTVASVNAIAAGFTVSCLAFWQVARAYRTE